MKEYEDYVKILARGDDMMCIGPVDGQALAPGIELQYLKPCRTSVRNSFTLHAMGDGAFALRNVASPAGSKGV